MKGGALMSRCLAAYFLRPHDVLLTLKRRPDGALVKPHVITWECRRCGKVVGETSALVVRELAGAPIVPTTEAPRRHLRAVAGKGSH